MEKNIIKIIAGYLKYWYLFLIGAVVCFALAYFYARYSVKPLYYIGGKVMLNDKQEGEGLQSFGNLGLIKQSTNIQDQIGVLVSFDLMKEVVNELNLSVKYFVEGRFTEVELYGNQVPFNIIFSDSVPLSKYGTLGHVVMVDQYSYRIEKYSEGDIVKKTTHEFGEVVSSEFGDFKMLLKEEGVDPKTPIIVRFSNPSGIAASYTSRLDVYPVYRNGSNLLQVELVDGKSDRGLDVVNKLIDVYAKKSADDKNFLANATLKLIDERLELLTEDLNTAEKSVESFKQNNDLTDVGSDATRFVALVDETERALSDLRVQISALNSLERNLNQSSSSSEFKILSAFNIQDPSLNAAIMAYNTEVQRRISIVNSTGIGNPMLPEIDSKLRQSRNLISQNIRSIQIELVKTQKQLLNKLGQYKSRKSSVPSAERALLEINRDQSIKNNLYLFLLQKREEEALSLSVPFSDIRVVEAPKTSGVPINGGKTPIYMGAILFGLFVPFAFIFVKDVLNTKIKDKGDIESNTLAPIIGEISEKEAKDVLVVSTTSVSPIAELFRLLRHNLKFISQNENNSVIMVTSGKQGEGKTFISINLGASLSLTGKKVIVLGFDLRVPKLMNDIGLKANNGLTDYIVDDSIALDDIIVKSDKLDNLSFIGAGAIPPNPGEIILSDKVGQLIEYLKTKFDYIILDTPPVGKVSDAYAFAPYVNSTLFVVRNNYTKKEELNIVNEILKNKKIAPLMLVHNDVKIGNTSGGYSYGYGGK